MSNLISIENATSLARDLSANTIVSTDTCEYEKYLILKSQKEEERNKIQHMEDEIHALRHDLSEIKQLLLAFKK